MFKNTNNMMPKYEEFKTTVNFFIFLIIQIK